MTMVEPAATVGAADDTIVEPAPAASVPASSGKGWASYSQNKKLAIGAGAGIVVGLGIYMWRKHRADNAVGAAQPVSSSSATGAGNTAPMYVLPSSNQDAVQGANDAALLTALGSIGSELNQIGTDVNNPPPTQVTVTNNGQPPPTGTPTGTTTTTTKPIVKRWYTPGLTLSQYTSLLQQQATSPTSTPTTETRVPL